MNKHNPHVSKTVVVIAALFAIVTFGLILVTQINKATPTDPNARWREEGASNYRDKVREWKQKNPDASGRTRGF